MSENNLFCVGVAKVTIVVVQRLDKLIELRSRSEVRGKYQLNAYNDDARIQRTFKVVSGPEQYSFLVWRDSEEEAVFYVQGLLASCSLPPVFRRSR